MTEELLINITQHESRVAWVKDGLLQEIHIEREYAKGLVGNIYCGKITRLLPTLQAAFVDIGLEKAAFLHMRETKIYRDSLHVEIPTNNLTINDVFKSGQKILVQVIKDPVGSKGARLTTLLSLPSRYLALTPNMPYIAVSQKIHAEAEQQRLTAALNIENNHGYIIRTAAEGVAVEELQKDAASLQKCG